MDPFPVRITNSSEWWLPWLPVLGSSLVALAAFVGVLLSNRTNRRAIEAADDREWVKWQREKLSGIADDVLTTAHLCSARLRGFAIWEPKDVQSEYVEINNSLAAIPDLARRLELVVGDALSKECTAIHQAIVGCMEVVNTEYVSSRKLFEAGDSEASLAPMDPKAKAVAEACRTFAAAVRIELRDNLVSALSDRSSRSRGSSRFWNRSKLTTRAAPTTPQAVGQKAEQH
jgi:hypothetical protein